MRKSFLPVSPVLPILSAIIGILFGLTVGARGFVLPPTKVVTVTTNRTGLVATNYAFVTDSAAIHRRSWGTKPMPLSLKIFVEARDWIRFARLWWGLPSMLLCGALMILVPKAAVSALRRLRPPWASHNGHGHVAA